MAIPKLLTIAAVLVLSAGCTTDSLSRRTVGQADTFMDIHYRQVMENLAMVAENPEVLPSYSVFDFGTTDITDKAGITGAVTIPPKGVAATGFLDPAASRTVKDNWTLTPVVAPEKLRALHLAFLFGVYNDRNLLIVHDHHVTLDVFCYPRTQGDNALQQVRRPNCDQAPCCCTGEPGYYFNVSRGLATLPPCWLKVGCKKDVPKCACFTASCGSKHIWVEDMRALSLFTLAIEEIAHSVVANFYFPKPNTSYTFNTTVPIYWCVPSTSGNPIPTANKELVSASMTLPVDCYGHIVALKTRQEGINTSDKHLQSSLSGSAKSP